MPNTDPRRMEGGKVHALACHVANLSECNRRYGSNAKSKLVNGRVVSVQNRPTATGRASTMVRAMYKLSQQETKEAELNIRSVKEGWVEGPNFDATNARASKPSNVTQTAATASPEAQTGPQWQPNNTTYVNQATAGATAKVGPNNGPAEPHISPSINVSSSDASETGVPTPRAAHLTPTRKRKSNNPSQSLQSKCVVCGMKTRDICSSCYDRNSQKEVPVCHSKTGRTCFAQHLAKSHGT